MENKRKFKPGVYAVVAGVIVAAVLVLITIFAFTARYTAFSPEKVAQSYVDTIVQTGDGYNAYKNTLVSKNQKFGDFIINAYMKPYINDGDDVKQADFVGTGNDAEADALDKVYSTMYNYYIELLEKYGLDDYDSIFTNYFARLSEVRKAVYNDDYMDSDYMFGVFESNVSQYGQSLTGTEEKLADDNKTVIQEKTIGKYQQMFGEDYKFTTTVTECTPLSQNEVKSYVNEYKARIASAADCGEQRADEFGLKDTTVKTKMLFFTKDDSVNNKSDMINAYKMLDCSADISEVSKCIVEVKLDDSTVVATQQLYVVRIGNSWYVDNTNVDTSSLYLDM